MSHDTLSYSLLTSGSEQRVSETSQSFKRNTSRVESYIPSDQCSDVFQTDRGFKDQRDHRPPWYGRSVWGDMIGNFLNTVSDVHKFAFVNGVANRRGLWPIRRKEKLQTALHSPPDYFSYVANITNRKVSLILADVVL